MFRQKKVLTQAYMQARNIQFDAIDARGYSVEVSSRGTRTTDNLKVSQKQYLGTN